MLRIYTIYVSMQTLRLHTTFGAEALTFRECLAPSLAKDTTLVVLIPGMVFLRLKVTLGVRLGTLQTP